MKKTKIPTTRRLRTISQGVFLLIVGLVATNHYLAEIGKEMPIVGTASLHAICPYGGIETIVSLVTMGVFVQKIHMSSVVLTALIVLLGLLFGPVVCSYICPLGTVQEWIGKIGKKLFGKHYNQMVPKKIRRYPKVFKVWCSYLHGLSDNQLTKTYFSRSRPLLCLI